MRSLLLFVAALALAWSGTARPSYAQDTPAAAPKRLLLIGQGPDTHPRGTHEYRRGVHLVARSLRNVPDLQTQVVSADGDWLDGPELLGKTDGAVLFVSEGAKWLHGDPRRVEAFAQLAARGGGLSVLHWGMGTKPPEYVEGFVKLFGGCHGGPDRRYQISESRLRIADEKHPITSGMKPFEIRDEFYYALKFVDAGKSIQPLITVEIDGQQHAIAWGWQRPDKGRSFGFSGLHFHDNWRREEYRQLVCRGVLWSVGVDPQSAGPLAPLDDSDFAVPAP